MRITSPAVYNFGFSNERWNFWRAMEGLYTLPVHWILLKTKPLSPMPWKRILVGVHCVRWDDGCYDCLSDFYLVDVSTRHPELKRRPGLTTWWPSVNRESTTSYETYQDFLNSPHAQSNTKLTEGHWPPKEFESLNLHRWSVLCIILIQ